MENTKTRAYTKVEKAQLRPTPGDGLGRGDLSIPTSLVDRTNALIRGLDLILDHHGVHETIRVALSKQVHDYLDGSLTEGVWLKKGKYLLAYPMAKYLRNELPELFGVDTFIPKGILRRFMKSRINAYNRKNTHLWFSWLQGKRSCLPASEAMINEAYDKHLSTLTKEDTGCDLTINAIMNNIHFKEHLDSIRAGVVEQFLKSKKHWTERHASLSAAFESNRTEEGAHGAIHRLVIGKEAEDPSYLIGRRSELYKMEFRPKSLVNGRYMINTTHEIRTTDSYDNANDWTEKVLISRSELKRRQLSAKIQGIVEPMKVRVISKGPALDYYFMQELQKALHSTMRKMNCYRLIGRPLSPTDIPDLYVSPIKHGLEGDEEWISVDYSAATDGLSWKYSGSIFRYIIQDLPTTMQAEALDVLGPHSLTYPKRDGRGYEAAPRGVMRRGQLMGSILSFPVLCAANLGLYLHVTEEYQQGWTLQERLDSVLVNGDDQLYLAPKRVFNYHIQEGMKVGLEMTVGKAYHHRSYTNVNSTCVDCPIGGTPYKVDFLNTGLFFGQNKVMAKVSTVEETYRNAEQHTRSGIVTVLNETLRGALPGRQSRLLKAWFRTHSTRDIQRDQYILLRRRVHYRNLFLPIIFGGLGVEAPIDFKFTITRQDRRYAMILNKDRHQVLTMAGPQLPNGVKCIETLKPLSSFNQSKDQSTIESRHYFSKCVVPRFYNCRTLREAYQLAASSA